MLEEKICILGHMKSFNFRHILEFQKLDRSVTQWGPQGQQPHEAERKAFPSSRRSCHRAQADLRMGTMALAFSSSYLENCSIVLLNVRSPFCLHLWLGHCLYSQLRRPQGIFCEGILADLDSQLLDRKQNPLVMDSSLG